MRQRTLIRYSLGFKQQVIRQLESGRFDSISEAQEHFGIKGGSTITYWLRKYGRNHLCAKVVRVEKPDEKMPDLNVPGNFPYKERRSAGNISPATNELCNLCGDCAPVCPTAAITIDDSLTSDDESCILCCACVKICPEDARVMDDAPIRKAASWLTENFSSRKEPKIFFQS